jgi:hypothetical protein
MATPYKNKARLWISRSRGLKSPILGDTKSPALERDDIPDVQVTNKIKRGDLAQELRLRYYPTVDINLNEYYAGEIPGATIDDVTNRLLQMGMRNNPTAYVEVTDEYGPDDASYAKQFITEDGSRIDVPQISAQPTFWKRLKNQYHVVLYDVNDSIILACHKEVSAWLQPARHVAQPGVSGRLGVRDFRQMWFDEFDEELPGKQNVKWRTLV